MQIILRSGLLFFWLCPDILLGNRGARPKLIYWNPAYYSQVMRICSLWNLTNNIVQLHYRNVWNPALTACHGRSKQVKDLWATIQSFTNKCPDWSVHAHVTWRIRYMASINCRLHKIQENLLSHNFYISLRKN